MDHSVKATTGNRNWNSNGNSEVGIELEAMRKHDFSWHPCKVSLCSTGIGLIIEYLTNGSSETIVNKEEALERIRFRSIPLKDDDCSLIQKGDHVLAKRRVRRETLLLDAKVDKALSVRDSKKVHPRCTFVVKWINNQVEGETATVPCNSMWKVSNKNIGFHPTIFGFFGILGSSSCFSISPMPTLADGMGSKFDTNELGKKIEKISNSADAAEIKSSEKEQKDDMLGSAGHGLTRMPVHMEIKSPHHKEFFESKPLLNPIAARAALASMISKLHNNSGVSLVQQEAEEFTPSKVFIGSTPYNNSVVTNFIETDDHSFDTKSGKQKHATVVTELFPNGKAEKEAQIMYSPCVSRNKRKMDKELQEYSQITAKACVSRQNKSSKDVLRPSNRARRLTRSAISELEDEQTAETKIDSAISVINGKEAAETRTIARQKQDMVAAREIVLRLVGGEKEVAYSNTKRGMCGSDGTRNSRRLTRSSVQGAAEKDYKTSCKGLEENRSSGCVKLNTEVNVTAVTTMKLNEGKVSASISSPKLGEDATCSTSGRQGTKRKPATLKTQALRSSPRLRLLAQTGTENKS